MRSSIPPMSKPAPINTSTIPNRIQEQTKKYQEQLEEEINQDRVAHGKKPLPKTQVTVKRGEKVSTTDLSGAFRQK